MAAPTSTSAPASTALDAAAYAALCDAAEQRALTFEDGESLQELFASTRLQQALDQYGVVLVRRCDDDRTTPACAAVLAAVDGKADARRVDGIEVRDWIVGQEAEVHRDLTFAEYREQSGALAAATASFGQSTELLVQIDQQFMIPVTPQPPSADGLASASIANGGGVDGGHQHPPRWPKAHYMMGTTIESLGMKAAKLADRDAAFHRSLFCAVRGQSTKAAGGVLYPSIFIAHAPGGFAMHTETMDRHSAIQLLRGQKFIFGVPSRHRAAFHSKWTSTSPGGMAAPMRAVFQRPITVADVQEYEITLVRLSKEYPLAIVGQRVFHWGASCGGSVSANVYLHQPTESERQAASAQYVQYWTNIMAKCMRDQSMALREAQMHVSYFRKMYRDMHPTATPRDVLSLIRVPSTSSTP